MHETNPVKTVDRRCVIILAIKEVLLEILGNNDQTPIK